MNDELPPIAVLLKEARGAYGIAIHHEVANRHLDRLPPQGAFIIGALHNGLSLEDIMHERGREIEKALTISRLVESGYLHDDVRELRLTEKGHECAHAVSAASSGLTNSLIEALGEDGFESFVKGLVTLIEFKEDAQAPR